MSEDRDITADNTVLHLSHRKWKIKLSAVHCGIPWCALCCILQVLMQYPDNLHSVHSMLDPAEIVKLPYQHAIPGIAYFPVSTTYSNKSTLPPFGQNKFLVNCLNITFNHVSTKTPQMKLIYQPSKNILPLGHNKQWGQRNTLRKTCSQDGRGFTLSSVQNMRFWLGIFRSIWTAM